MNDIKRNIPVLLIIFNRPAAAQQSLQAIRRYQPRRLYVAADGPRPEREGEQERCEQTRSAVLQAIDWDCEVSTLLRDENVGCGRGVSEAITWMLEHEEYGIIVEDDCIVSPDFFRLCEEVLPRYKDNDRVAQISGFNPAFSGQTTDTYSFTGYPEIWGWATWRRAWQNMDFEMAQWRQVRWKIFTRFLPVEACMHFYFWRKMYQTLRRASKPSIWDTQWSIYVFMQRKLCLYPHANLVQNIGMGGGDASNCHNVSEAYSAARHGKLRFPLRHPQQAGLIRREERKRSRRYVLHYAGILLRKLSAARFD
jgi:hypothetical protein